MVAKLLGTILLSLFLLPPPLLADDFTDAVAQFADQELSLEERQAAASALRKLPTDLTKTELDDYVEVLIAVLLEVKSEPFVDQELGVQAAELLVGVVANYRSRKATFIWNQINNNILRQIDQGFLFASLLDALRQMALVPGNEKNKEEIVAVISKRLEVEQAKPAAKRSRLSQTTLRWNLEIMQGVADRTKALKEFTGDLMNPVAGREAEQYRGKPRLTQELHRYASKAVAELLAGEPSDGVAAVEPSLWMSWLERLSDRKTFKRDGEFEVDTRINLMQALAKIRYVAAADPQLESRESMAFFEVILNEDNETAQPLLLDVCQRWAAANPDLRYRDLLQYSMSLLDDNNHKNIKLRYFAVLSIARVAALAPDSLDHQHQAWQELMQEIEDPAIPVSFCRDAVWGLGRLPQLTLTDDEKAHTAEVLTTACNNHSASVEVCEHAKITAGKLGIAI